MKVETLLVRKATLPVVKAKREPASQSNPDLTPRTYLRHLATAVSRVPASATDHRAIEVQRSLRNLHLLLRSERLYEKDHPLRLDSLDSAYDSILAKIGRPSKQCRQYLVAGATSGEPRGRHFR